MTAPRHLHAIDALRFACALAVLAYHVGTVFPLAASSATRAFGAAALPSGAAAWTAWGWIGVEIFFVISGHVIATSLAGVDRAAFARARVLRLLPAALVCATLTAVVLAASGTLAPHDIATRWAASLAMLPFGPRIDGVWWTLQVEVSFYLLVAATLRLRIAHVGCALTAWSAAYWLWAIASGHVVDGMATPASLMLLPHGGLFALGIAIHAGVATPARRCALLAALAVALVEVGARAVAADGAGGVATSPAIPVAAFLAGVAILARAGAIEPWLRARHLLARLGRATYPLYLVNQIVGAATIVVLLRLGIPPAPAMALAALATIALADAIARTAEPKLRRRLAALLSPRRARPPDSLPSAFPRAG